MATKKPLSVIIFDNNNSNKRSADEEVKYTYHNQNDGEKLLKFFYDYATENAYCAKV